MKYYKFNNVNISHSTLVMITARKISYTFLVVLMPLMGFSINFDISKKLDHLETYSLKMKGDSVLAALTLDSAKAAFQNHNYEKSIGYAEKSFELSKKFPNSDF
ncbi:MAG: hypothetical protein KAI99_07705, partial [Cyclobacteriaceae bacterium]|nr:hypothetical protein [Cyclobacteriaceae bacterium]